MNRVPEYSHLVFIIPVYLRARIVVYNVYQHLQLPLDTPFWTRCFPACNAISEGRLPLCNTSSEAGALPSEVRIENDSDRKFSKSIFFQSFSGNHFSPRLLAENIFSVFRRPHSAPTPRYTILDLRLLPCNAISEGRLPLCNTSSEAGALPSDKQYMIYYSIIPSMRSVLLISVF